MWYLIIGVIAFTLGVLFAEKTRGEIATIENKIKDEAHKVETAIKDEVSKL